MTPGAPAVLVDAALRRRQQIALVFDGTGAQQQFPMDLTGSVGEGRRRQYQVQWAQRAIQLGKAQVVADRQTQPKACDIGNYRRAAGFNRVGLVKAFTATVQSEQVNLVVTGQPLTIGAKQQAGVSHLVDLVGNQGHGTTEQPDAMTGGGLRQK